MTTFIGIDPSLSATAVVVLSEDAALIESHVVSSKPSGRLIGERMARFEHLVRRVKKIVDASQPLLICIEAYSFGSKGAGVSSMYEYGGLLRYVLNRDYKLIEVAPTTLKKWATGKGQCEKTAVICAITSRYGQHFQTDDEFDAYALARMALQIEKHEEPATVAQRESIHVAVNGTPKKVKVQK